MSFEESQQLQPAKKRKPCMRIGCIIFIVLSVLAIGGIVTLRVLLNQRLTPEQSATLHNMESEIITLPRDWHQPATLPSDDSLALAERFIETMDNILDTHYDLMLGGPGQGYESSLMGQRVSGNVIVSPEQQTSYSLLLADLQPLIDETSRTVAQPDYTVETELYTSDTAAFLRLQSFAKLCAVVAHQQARAGDCLHAFDTAALPIRVLKRSEQASQFTHIIGIAIAGISCSAFDSVSEQCSDTRSLEYGSSLLTDLKESAFPGDYNLWRYGDSIGMLGRAAANGYPVDLSPQTLLGFYKQASELNTPRYYQWLIDNLPADDQRAIVARARLEQWAQWQKEGHKVPADSDVSSWWYPLAEKTMELAIGANPIALLYLMVDQNYEEAKIRTEIVKAKYELTQFKIARRLAELKGEPPPEIPPDPFTSAPLSFSPANNLFYSVGPDKEDNKTQIIYDTTNGTISRGDIFKKRD